MKENVKNQQVNQVKKEEGRKPFVVPMIKRHDDLPVVTAGSINIPR